MLVLIKSDYLYLIAIITVFIALTGFIYSNTNAFYAATTNNKLIKYDVIFTTDSSNHLQDNVFMNVNAHENDLRQPLFAVFALPFTVLAKAIASLFNENTLYYAIAINAIQVTLLALGSLMICQLLKLKGFTKYLFLILMPLSYSYLVFSIVIEQYVFAFFWLILFIYSVLTEQNQPAKDLLFIGATGSLLTSGIIFILLKSLKNIKDFAVTVFITAIKFFSVVTLFAQTTIFINYKSFLNAYSPYTSQSISFMDKVYQYLNFVASCLVKPLTVIDTTSYQHISYQLKATTSLNVLGLLLIALAVFGFITNYKSKYAKICLGWLCYSFTMLVLVGWGTSENGLILYALYFAWVFMSLWYLAIKSIFNKHHLLKNATLIGIITVIRYANIKGFVDIVKFAFRYYPR